MREPTNQHVDSQLAGRNELGALFRSPSDVQAPGGKRSGIIKRASLAMRTTNEWLVSCHTTMADDPVWPNLDLRRLRPESNAKVIYNNDIRRDDLRTSRANEMCIFNTMIKTTSVRIPDMVISDRRIAFIAADPADRSAGIICTEQPAIISILASFFDHAWSMAIPLKPSHEQESAGQISELREAERSLLKLLADGATDETAARQLGMSLRTARRRMAAIMNDLAATSRFQAGAEAAKRGWLT